MMKRRYFMRAAVGAALVSGLSLGATAAFAAAGPDGSGEGPDALPTGAISQAAAEQDALKGYGAGATAVFDSVNDQNGTITYGFTVTAGGTTYDVQVDALKGTIVQADAAGTEPGETGGATDGPNAGGGGQQ